MLGKKWADFSMSSWATSAQVVTLANISGSLWMPSLEHWQISLCPVWQRLTDGACTRSTFGTRWAAFSMSSPVTFCPSTHLDKCQWMPSLESTGRSLSVLCDKDWPIQLEPGWRLAQGEQSSAHPVWLPLPKWSHWLTSVDFITWAWLAFLSLSGIKISWSSLNQLDVGHMASRFQHVQLGHLCPGGQIGERQWILSLERWLCPVWQRSCDPAWTRLMFGTWWADFSTPSLATSAQVVTLANVSGFRHLSPARFFSLPVL